MKMLSLMFLLLVPNLAEGFRHSYSYSSSSLYPPFSSSSCRSTPRKTTTRTTPTGAAITIIRTSSSSSLTGSWRLKNLVSTTSSSAGVLELSLPFRTRTPTRILQKRNNRLRQRRRTTRRTTSRTTRSSLWSSPSSPSSSSASPSSSSLTKRIFSSLDGAAGVASMSSGTPAVISTTSTLSFMSSFFKSLFRFTGGVPLIQSTIINVMLFGILYKKLFTMLTLTGYINAMLLGIGLWTTLGWRGWSYCVMYLFLGQAVTKVKFQDKQKRGLAEGRDGRRGPENVWGSAATSLACAICANLVSYSSSSAAVSVSVSSLDYLRVRIGNWLSFNGVMTCELYVLGFIVGLATKLADTFASEIGKAYGKTTFLITTFQRVSPGTEGAVSLEGTLASIVGGFLLSLYGYSIKLLDNNATSSFSMVLISTFAAFIATNVESVLGATMQQKNDQLQWLTNEVINFFNTVIGAIIAIFIAKNFIV